MILLLTIGVLEYWLTNSCVAILLSKQRRRKRRTSAFALWIWNSLLMWVKKRKTSFASCWCWIRRVECYWRMHWTILGSRSTRTTHWLVHCKLCLFEVQYGSKSFMLKNEKNRGENRNEGCWNSQIDGCSEITSLYRKLWQNTYILSISFIHSCGKRMWRRWTSREESSSWRVAKHRSDFTYIAITNREWTLADFDIGKKIGKGVFGSSTSSGVTQ